jgi:alpha-N-acetylglucosaminidase
MAARLFLCALYFARAAADPVMSATGLLSRLLGPDAVPLFQLEAIPSDPTTGLDVFEMDAAGSRVVLRGNTGVAISTALNNYLKYTLNASVSWGREGSGVLVRLPPTLPLPLPLRTVMPMKWRYAWNVCTAGYSFAWYSAEQWRWMIDWMALQGVNLPLAFNGQEKVFSDVFLSLGLTQQEVWEYFSGPAFLPWNRLGNIQAWGALYSEVSGLDEGWMESQYELQVGIVAAMRELGMTPVLPGFAGHVPRGMQRVLPNAQFTHSEDWFGFNSTFGSVMLLEPTDPAYVTLGAAINKAILAAFGDPSGVEIPHLNADAFNEMKPNNSSMDYLKLCNSNMYASMTAADPRAVYVMQGWLFLKGFWTYERTQAFLSGVPIGGMLILDLYSDGAPQWSKYDSYFGHNWIWNSLIVFGGRRGLYGTLDSLASSPYADRNKSASLVGVGVTPEAIDMSQPMFDVTLEAGWRSAPPEPQGWLQQYAVRRYGGQSPLMAQATDLLYAAAYKDFGIDESIIEDFPGSAGAGSRNTNATGILAALRLYIDAFSSGELDATTGPASYDLTDLTRQVLCNLFSDLYGVWVNRVGAPSPSVTQLRPIADALLGIIADIDDTNAGDKNFLLGTWLADAAAWGFNSSQVANRLFNARNQITLWGPKGGAFICQHLALGALCPPPPRLLVCAFFFHSLLDPFPFAQPLSHPLLFFQR